MSLLNSIFGSVLSLITLCISSAIGSEVVSFSRDVKPILAEKCFACHGMDEQTRAVGLRLDQRDAAIDAGAIVEGDPQSSSLIERVFSDDPNTMMPPGDSHKTLTESQKDILKRWVEQGASYSKHWSLIPPVKAEVPEVRDKAWPRNEIDRFVLSGLDAVGLKPAPEIDPHRLFRRLSLDITGLPPVSKDLNAFVDQCSNAPDRASKDAVVSTWIDRLMERPTWGEHRARYWLDAARYADTHGFHFDNYREMWPYRDWVIRAFNRNQPFDQFVVEQLAGDLLNNPTRDQRIATGFQRCNMTTNEGGTIAAENYAIYAADRVQTFGWVFLGLTTNCCQCHDHKFDPLTMKDYYSLAAFFRNTTQKAKDGNNKDGNGPVIVVPYEKDAARWEVLPSEIAAIEKKMNQRRNESESEFEQWLVNLDVSTLDEVPGDGLRLHLPMCEGEGNKIHHAAPSMKWQTRRLAEDASGAVPKDKQAVVFVQATEKANAIARMSRQSFKVPKPKWHLDGIIGPSLQIAKGKPLSLGRHGDFAADQPYSAGCWVKTTSASNAAILGRMNPKHGNRGWDILQNMHEFSAHLIEKWRDSAVKVMTTGKRVKFGKWQHVLITWDGTGKAKGMKIYIDGKLAETKVVVDQLKKDSKTQIEKPLLIGARAHGAVPFKGRVQDVVLYNRVLSPAEIESIVMTGVTRQAKREFASGGDEKIDDRVRQFYLNRYDVAYGKLKKQRDVLNSEVQAIKDRSPVTHVQVEKNSPAMTHVLVRGAYDKLGDEVFASTPVALHSMPEGAPANRLGLAKWVIDPNNPLTARVTVNRFWQEIMGRGIVATSEDFGIMGTPPSNQALLDWLAVDFRDSGWDVKRLFKMILTSSTYCQSSNATVEKRARDGDNSKLSRGPRFRMDAEMVRDYALRASGLLVGRMYGHGVKPYQPKHVWNVVGLGGGNTRWYVQDKGEKLYRRSLYSFWKRMSPPPNLEAFNAPNREVCTVRRERTNTPLMALVTLNDTQFVEAARVLAQSAMLEAGEDLPQTLNAIALRTVCRSWTDQERSIIQGSFVEYQQHYETNPDDVAKLLAVGESPIDKTLDRKKLAAMTMVCNEVLNLDEVLNK